MSCEAPRPASRLATYEATAEPVPDKPPVRRHNPPRPPTRAGTSPVWRCLGCGLLNPLELGGSDDIHAEAVNPREAKDPRTLPRDGTHRARTVRRPFPALPVKWRSHSSQSESTRTRARRTRKVVSPSASANSTRWDGQQFGSPGEYREPAPNNVCGSIRGAPKRGSPRPTGPPARRDNSEAGRTDRQLRATGDHPTSSTPARNHPSCSGRIPWPGAGHQASPRLPPTCPGNRRRLHGRAPRPQVDRQDHAGMKKNEFEFARVRCAGSFELMDRRMPVESICPGRARCGVEGYEADDAARRLPRGLPEPLLVGEGDAAPMHAIDWQRHWWMEPGRITELSLRLRPRDFGVADGYHRSNGTHEEVTHRDHTRRKPERSADAATALPAAR